MPTKTIDDARVAVADLAAQRIALHQLAIGVIEGRIPVVDALVAGLRAIQPSGVPLPADLAELQSTDSDPSSMSTPRWRWRSPSPTTSSTAISP